MYFLEDVVIFKILAIIATTLAHCISYRLYSRQGKKYDNMLKMAKRDARIKHGIIKRTT